MKSHINVLSAKGPFPEMSTLKTHMRTLVKSCIDVLSAKSLFSDWMVENANEKALESGVPMRSFKVLKMILNYTWHY